LGDSRRLQISRPPQPRRAVFSEINAPGCPRPHLSQPPASLRGWPSAANRRIFQKSSGIPKSANYSGIGDSHRSVHRPVGRVRTFGTLVRLTPRRSISISQMIVLWRRSPPFLSRNTFYSSFESEVFASCANTFRGLIRP